MRCFRCTAILFWLAAGSVTAAEGPEVSVECGAEEIFVGDSVDYLVEIRNVKNPLAPDLTAFKQSFDVVANGDQSRNQSSKIFFNGRWSESSSFSHVYRFRLTPKSTGELKIPAIAVTVDGKTITSSELSLRVIEPEKQDLVLVEIETSPSRIYRTQPFTVTVRVLVQPLPSGMSGDPLGPVRSQPPHLQMNWVDVPAGLKAEDTSHWLQPLLSDDGVGFTLNEISARSNSFFETSRSAVLGLFKGRESRDGFDGKPIRYFVYELSRTFTPEIAGEYTFGPTVVKGTFVSGISQRKPVGKRLVTIAAAKTVDVHEVPSPQPVTYSGGIGEFRLTASASPSRLRVGDPLTLNLEFERGPHSGSLELVSAPDLSANSKLIADFDLVDKSPTGRVEGSIKKFAYAIRPRRANVSIPSLNISTFDPKTEQFIEQQTAAIPLDVSEAAQVSAGDLVGSVPTTGTAAIKSRAQGIYQNVTDPSALRDERINVVLWSEAAAGFWSAAGCFIAIVTVYRRKSSDAGWLRRQQAKKAALRRLDEARRSLALGNSKEALGHVRSAIIGIVADTQNRIADGLTTADIADALSIFSVPEANRTEVLKLLESIESAEYGAVQSADPATTIESAAHAIVRIHPFIQRGA